MEKTQFYISANEDQAKRFGFESLTYPNWIARLGCAADSYEENIAQRYEIATTPIENVFYAYRFYHSRADRVSQTSDRIFGFAEFFIKRPGQGSKSIPDLIHVANNLDDLIKIIYVAVALCGVRVEIRVEDNY